MLVPELSATVPARVWDQIAAHIGEWQHSNGGRLRQWWCLDDAPNMPLDDGLGGIDPHHERLNRPRNVLQIERTALLELQS